MGWYEIGSMRRIEFTLLAAIVVLPVAAQSLVAAGGNWVYRAERDQMTDGYWHTFTLKADGPVAEGITSGTPEITITCGKVWRDTRLDTPVVIASDVVELSVNGKKRFQPTWDLSSDRKSFFIKGIGNIGATKEILRSADYRVRFEAYPGHYLVARFSPAGVDRQMLVKACGPKFATEK
jgi:hypothetical protein